MDTSGRAEMKMVEVMAFVIERTGMRRSRATVYNWATKGTTIRGIPVRLRFEIRAGQMFTKVEWVEDFLAKIDQR